MSLELHFNSYHKTAYGCEALVFERAPNQDFSLNCEYADIITDCFNEDERYQFKERHDDGVKLVNMGDRGAYNLKKIHELAKAKTALLIEPNFVNKPTPQAKKIIEDPNGYAKFLSEVILVNCLGAAQSSI
jgi:hypothetical protein